MNRLWLVIAVGCYTSPPVAPKNETPVVEVRCKAAVEHAAPIADLRARDVTYTIGECEQQEWSRPLRECVHTAKTGADLQSCGKQYAQPAHGVFRGESSFAVAIKAMERFRDEICACKDTACAQRVSDEMTKWSQEQARDERDPPKMTEEDTRRATAIGEQMGKCMMAAMGTGTGTP